MSSATRTADGGLYIVQINGIHSSDKCSSGNVLIVIPWQKPKQASGYLLHVVVSFLNARAYELLCVALILPVSLHFPDDESTFPFITSCMQCTLTLICFLINQIVSKLNLFWTFDQYRTIAAKTCAPTNLSSHENVVLVPPISGFAKVI